MIEPPRNPATITTPDNPATISTPERPPLPMPATSTDPEKPPATEKREEEKRIERFPER
jgi:hypothetical protein